MAPMPYYEPVILERRELGAHALLTLHAPELARAAKPGQLALVACGPQGADDPLLRRPLFFAGADGAAGVVELLVAPDERGLAWLATQPVGARLDLYGPVGGAFAVEGRAHNLLLAGAGPALPALIFLARAAVARGGAVVLLAAGATAALPPPFLLPADVEYQTGPDLLALMQAGAPRTPGLPAPGSPIVWADQLCLALTGELVAAVMAAVRAARLRWQSGFALAAVAGAMPCGLGTCLACPIETREGLRLRCKDGPVFDLRDLR